MENSATQDLVLVAGYGIVLGGAYIGYRIYADKKKPPPEYTARDVVQFLTRASWGQIWQAFKPGLISLVSLTFAAAAATAIRQLLGGK